jgi:Flp pilus assembly protein protease CpaA
MERRWLPLTLVILLVVAAFFLAQARYAGMHTSGARWMIVLAVCVLAIGFSKLGRSH